MAAAHACTRVANFIADVREPQSAHRGDYKSDRKIINDKRFVLRVDEANDRNEKRLLMAYCAIQRGPGLSEDLLLCQYEMTGHSFN